MREKIIVAGFGGQGIMFLGKLLAQAMMEEGLHVTYFPSYGPEVRGGRANCHVIVASDEIFSPIVVEPDALFALSQPAWDFFAPQRSRDGLAVVNATLVETADAGAGEQMVAVPATEIASELGDVRAANMVLLGAYNARRGLLPADALIGHLKSALGERKAALFDVNRRAIEKGIEAVRR